MKRPHLIWGDLSLWSHLIWGELSLSSHLLWGDLSLSCHLNMRWPLTILSLNMSENKLVWTSETKLSSIKIVCNRVCYSYTLGVHTAALYTSVLTRVCYSYTLGVHAAALYTSVRYSYTLGVHAAALYKSVRYSYTLGVHAAALYTSVRYSYTLGVDAAALYTSVRYSYTLGIYTQLHCTRQCTRTWSTGSDASTQLGKSGTVRLSLYGPYSALTVSIELQMRYT